MALNDKEKEELRIEARGILDSFAKVLSGVKLTDKKEVSGSAGYRESSNLTNDKDFRKKMFANAPKSNADFIIAERKQW